MAELVSPGVSITVIDESFYAAAGTGTVPLIVIATAENKTAPDGSGIASFTTASEAGKVKLITSQRELLTNYGNPEFKTLSGSPLHGHELNEYGLQTAYSFLGIANRAYVLRADLDLDQLDASTTAPVAAPAAGSYWLDTQKSQIGLKEWDGSTWVSKSVRILTATEVTGVGNGVAPRSSISSAGYVATVVDSEDNTTPTVTIWSYEGGTWVETGGGSSTKDYQVAPHTALPSNDSSGGTLQTGDVVLQTTAPNNGTSLVVKLWDASAGQYTTETVYGFEYSSQGYAALGGPSNVTEGVLWADFSSDRAEINIKRHNGDSRIELARFTTDKLALEETTAADHANGAIAFYIDVNDRAAQSGSNATIAVTYDGFDSDGDGNLSYDDIVTAIQSALSAADENITLADEIVVESDGDDLVIFSDNGYDVNLEVGNVAGYTLTTVESTVGLKELNSNFEDLSYTASKTSLTGDLADGTLWYDSLVSSDNMDILFNNAGTWTTYAGNVFVAASNPEAASPGTAATDDLWIDTGDLENYPEIYKWDGVQWVMVDTADQETDQGIIFGDFRASATGSLYADAPNASLYPYNILAWNKSATGGNVKQWDATNGRWVDYSGNRNDGSPYMLRKAQRRAVVRELQQAITSNTDIRNESNRFNLMAVPGYPELYDEMVSLNTDRKETAFVVVDAPLRLSPDATSLQAWATNSDNAVENGEDGLVTSYTYSAVYYPHALTTSLDGTNIVMPSSYIALRTIAFNDQVSFPWFAPAGFQRGVVTNATSVGYIDGTTAEYVPVSLSEGQRDALYINKVNPIGNFPNRGLAVFGQKTLNPTTTALDRVNVARLVVYIRERLDDIVRPFLFEPNDDLTRQNAKVVVDRFLGNLVAQRGLFDFVTVCDGTNNTPARIDRNELWIDIAIQPVKAVEFIYIPIRVQNTLGQTN